MTQRFKTKVTEKLGIEHPIIQGGMMWVSRPGLVAAVSNAGGLGVLTALTFESPAGLAAAIRETRSLTGKPFAVNLTFLPTLVARGYDELIEVIVGEGVGIVETAGRNPEPYGSERTQPVARTRVSSYYSGNNALIVAMGHISADWSDRVLPRSRWERRLPAGSWAQPTHGRFAS